MMYKIKPHQRVTIDESCENLALEGLRTLVIAQRIIGQEEYESWKAKYTEA